MQRYLPGLAIGAVLMAGSGTAQLPAQDQPRVPVLVELFTSEGCSDCPPADRLLEQLDKTQAIPGAQVIVLSEHVTYWNHLGWSDPFSMPEMDARQREYGVRFNLDSVYTPQVVVDGAAQVVGNNAASVVQAVARAASRSKQPLAITDAHWENGSAIFTVHAAAGPGAKLVAALAADGTRSEVGAGENAGRTLHHVAVVRAIKEFNAAAIDGRPLRLPGRGLADVKEGSGPPRLVVFIADRKTGHALAIAEQAVNPNVPAKAMASVAISPAVPASLLGVADEPSSIWQSVPEWLPAHPW